MNPFGNLTDFLPDTFLTPEQLAHKHFDEEAKQQALEGLRSRLSELQDAERVFSEGEAFMAEKTVALKKVQDALVFSRGDETLILQGRAVALWEFVESPKAVRKERLQVERQIQEIEQADAGLSGDE